MISPCADAVTVTSRFQLWPMVSFTMIRTDSPAAQFEPVSVTVSPGA
jgi:hypothetical protein